VGLQPTGRFRGVFTVAVQQILIDTNPMEKVAIGSKIESKRKPYSVEQVSLILTRAQAETDDIFLPLLGDLRRIIDMIAAADPALRQDQRWRRLDGIAG
jgi:hypothetical protein